GVQDIKKLCDRVITGFLAAVTAQAPDSGFLQFPADRAYFIPFEGDNAGRFNFSKPFFQLLNKLDAGPGGADRETYEGSIWSFCPWGPAPEQVRVSPDSVSGDRTIEFEDMISVREFFRTEEAERAPEPLAGVLGLRKFREQPAPPPGGGPAGGWLPR